MTKSMSCVSRGSPYTPLARDPTSMYGTSTRSRTSTVRRSSSSCSTRHPSHDLSADLSVRPLRVPRAKGALDSETHRSVGGKHHGELLRGRFAAEDVGDGVVDHFDLARVESPAAHDVIIPQPRGNGRCAPACARGRGTRGFRRSAG